VSDCHPLSGARVRSGGHACGVEGPYRGSRIAPDTRLAEMPDLRGSGGRKLGLFADLFQILLGFQGGHATRSRSRDRLPIMAVGHVTANEYTRRSRTDRPIGN